MHPPERQHYKTNSLSVRAVLSWGIAPPTHNTLNSFPWIRMRFLPWELKALSLHLSLTETVGLHRWPSFPPTDTGFLFSSSILPAAGFWPGRAGSIRKWHSRSRANSLELPFDRIGLFCLLLSKNRRQMLVTGVLIKHSQDGPRPLAANPEFPLAREIQSL